MKKSKYILPILFTMCLIFAVSLKSISRSDVSTNKPGHEMAIPTVAYGYQISQQIIPTSNYIESIILCVNSLKCDTTSGRLYIRLLDSNRNSICENSIPISELPSYGWFDALKNVRVSSGNTYYLTVETIDSTDDGPAISYFRSNTAAATEEENQQLTYAYLPLDDCVLKLKVIYDIPISKYEYIVYYIFILFIALFLYNRLIKSQKNHT